MFGIYLGIEFYLSVSHGGLNYRGSTYIFCNARSALGLAFVLMLRPFFSELVMSTDLLSFEHPSVLLFCLSKLSRFGYEISVF